MTALYLSQIGSQRFKTPLKKVGCIHTPATHNDEVGKFWARIDGYSKDAETKNTILFKVKWTRFSEDVTTIIEEKEGKMSRVVVQAPPISFVLPLTQCSGFISISDILSWSCAWDSIRIYK